MGNLGSEGSICMLSSAVMRFIRPHKPIKESKSHALSNELIRPADTRLQDTGISKTTSVAVTVGIEALF